MSEATKESGSTIGDASEGLASRLKDRKIALIGGAAAAVIGFATMALVGNATSFEARRLLEAAIPAVRYAASAMSLVAGRFWR